MFTIYDGTRKVGIVSYKIGTVLPLVEVRSQHAIVTVETSDCPLPATNTDIIEKLGGPEAILAIPDDPTPIK